MLEDKSIKIERQAVIIIHGVGEQNPMDTLREFVISVAPKIQNSNKPKFYNKPDQLSALYELRRITANRHAGSYKTDYFEYYWAHLMQGTRFSDIGWWIWQLLFRKPADIPSRLKWIYVLFWLSSIVALWLFFSAFFRDSSVQVNYFFPDRYWKLITSGVLLLLNYFIIEYLGDAARYMTPKPRNIAERQIIRKNGLDLLHRLHQENENGKRKYDRIIIVGHSLGSVIAYDLLNLYWNRIHTFSEQINPQQIEGIEKAANDLENGTITREDFRRAQFSLWKEQRPLQGSWLVSDFITIGSPLAHASLMLAKSPRVLLEKKQERELPTCPPMTEKKDNQDRFSYVSRSGQTILHHAAAFSITRWTNLFFDNDYVGGQIQDFGSGIENKFLTPTKLFWSFLPLRASIPFLSHTYYWDKSEEESIQYIREKMELMIKSPPVVS